MKQFGHVRKRVAVIGGGITGLAAAQRLVELDPSVDVTLFEAGPRLGGVLETVRRDGFLIERSADNFITSVPWALDLCREIGFESELLPTTSGQRNAMVVHRGRLEKLPAGFMLMAPGQLWPLATTPILSPWGKLRLLAEYFIPARRAEIDESLGSFARRRLGAEAFERIVQPLVGGIYTADPERLSLKATLPRFLEMERRYGSLIRAARAERRAGKSTGDGESGARYGLFVAPRQGMSSLVAALAARLPAGTVQLNSPVARIEQTSPGLWSVELGGVDADKQEFDGLIVAVAAPLAGQLLYQVDRPLAADLRRIDYASSVVVSLGLKREQIERRLDSFGFVVPAVEKRRILAGSFSSVKFAGRAPDDSALLRVFIGGACQPELAELPDERLREIAIDELRALVGLRGEPLFVDIVRHPRSMPQYHVGHCDLVADIEHAAGRWPGLALAGNAYHGVGIPNCVHSGRSAAERIGAAIHAA